MKTTILIIEDNEQNMYLESFILEKFGYRVLQAFNGSDGLKTACDENPELILLDIQLPVMDGYSVAREMRKQAHLKATPIIAVTSYAMPGDREQALAAGCSGYIEKPINPDTFIHQIEEFLIGTKDGESYGKDPDC